MEATSGSSCSALRINPDKVLEFQVTGGAQSQVVLHLENPNDNSVAFKIKTTAPKSYLVKPSSGVIGPKSAQEVNILLIPMFEPPKEVVSDRFLVQSTAVESDRTLSKDEWVELAMSKDKLDEKRLSVSLVWLGYASNGQDAVNPLLSKAIPGEYKQLRVMYEELVTYVGALDKQKREYETELDEIRRSGNRPGNRPGQLKNTNGMEFWQVAFLLVAVVVLLKCISFF